MAAPHVAGVVALLWSAAPWLRGDVSTTEAILRETAQPLADATACYGTPGNAIPNNTYGFGLIDTKAAVEKVLTPITTTAPITSPTTASITFTIAVSNASALTRTNVVITSGVPASTTVIASDPAGSVSGNVIEWMLPTLGPSSTLTVSFVVSATQVLVAGNAPVSLIFDGASRPIAGKAATTLIEIEGQQRVFFPFIGR